MYSAQDVQDAYFASRVDEMQRLGEGNVEEQWRAYVGPDARNLPPEETLEGWRCRYERGKAILAEAMLVKSHRQVAGADPLYSNPYHAGGPIPESELDSPIILVPSGYIATAAADRRIALKRRA